MNMFVISIQKNDRKQQDRTVAVALVVAETPAEAHALIMGNERIKTMTPYRRNLEQLDVELDGDIHPGLVALYLSRGTVFPG